jgi:hypothetical protein
MCHFSRMRVLALKPASRTSLRLSPGSAQSQDGQRRFLMVSHLSFRFFADSKTPNKVPDELEEIR